MLNKVVLLVCVWCVLINASSNVKGRLRSHNKLEHFTDNNLCMISKGGPNKCTILCFRSLIDTELSYKVERGVFTKWYCLRSFASRVDACVLPPTTLDKSWTSLSQVIFPSLPDPELSWLVSKSLTLQYWNVALCELS